MTSHDGGGGSPHEREAYCKARRVAVRAWAFVGCCVAFVLAMRALLLVGPAVELLLIGGVIAFICSPITNRLEDLGVPRALAALVAIVAVMAALAAALVVFGGPFVDQSVTVLRQVPSYVASLRSVLSGLWSSWGPTDNVEVQDAAEALMTSVATLGTDLAASAARQLSTNLVDNVMGTFDDLLSFFLGIVLAYWLAKDYPRIVRELSVVAGPRHADEMTLMFAVMSRSMGGYMRGQLITSIANALLAFVGCALVGHPFAGLVGTTTFVMHFIPVIGPFLSALLAVALALFVSPGMALWALVVMVVSQNVADNLLSPVVMQSAVKVHPALTLVGIVIGSALAGVAGMVLAIPLTAAIRSAFVYYFEAHTGRQLVSYDGALFRSTPYRDAEGSIQPSFDALDDDKFFESTRLVSRDSAPEVEAERRPAGAPRTIAEIVSEQAGHLADPRRPGVSAQDLRSGAADPEPEGSARESAVDSQRNEPGA